MDPKKKQLLASTGQSLEKISCLFGINLSSYLGKSYSFAILVLFSFLNYTAWDVICIGHCTKHVVVKFMIILQYMLHVFLVFTMVVTSLFHPKQFAFPRQEMIIIDSILESYGAQFPNKNIFIMKHLQDAIMVPLSLFTVMNFFHEIIVNNSIELISFSILSCYSVICLLVIDGLFCHYVNDIYLRFQELNKIAIQHSKDKLLIFYVDFTATSGHDERDSFVSSKLRSIQHIHHILTVLAIKVNTNFSLQLLIGSTISLNAIILYLFNIYHDMEENHINHIEIVSQLLFVLCIALVFFYISYVCQRTRNESRRMTKILYDAFLKHKYLRSEVVYFSLQLIHEDLVFTGYGLYEINLPLMCSIAEAIITYLVMVIQLSKTDKFAIAGITHNDFDEDNSTSMNSTA